MRSVATRRRALPLRIFVEHCIGSRPCWQIPARWPGPIRTAVSSSMENRYPRRPNTSAATPWPHSWKARSSSGRRQPGTVPSSARRWAAGPAKVIDACASKLERAAAAFETGRPFRRTRCPAAWAREHTPRRMPDSRRSAAPAETVGLRYSARLAPSRRLPRKTAGSALLSGDIGSYRAGRQAARRSAGNFPETSRRLHRPLPECQLRLSFVNRRV